MAETEETQDWLDELTEELSEKIGAVAKFKTHKQRKAFLGDIVNQIKTSVAANTIPKNMKAHPIRKTENAITRPNPNGKGLGYAVMDERLSAKGDDVLGVGPGSEQPGKADGMNNQNKGVRIW